MTVGITELPPEGMQLGGVALAGDADRGTKTTEGLSLLFTTAGITVQGPQPQIERLLVWSGLDTATCREKIALSDGRSAAVMELTSGGQSIRFLLPTETVTPGQAAYLDQALPAWLSRYKGVPGTGPAPASPGPAAAAGAAAAGAAVGAAVANGMAGAAPADAVTPPPPPADATGLVTPAGAAAPPSPAPPPPPPVGAAAPPAPGATGAPVPPPPPAPAGAGPEPGTVAAGQAFVPPASQAPPPPPPPPMGGQPVGTTPGTAPGQPTGWEGLTTPAPAGEPALGWDGQPLGQAAAADVLPPPKKTRSWRKGRQAAPAASAAAATQLGQFGAPSGPPTQPVPLAQGALPRPPDEFQAPGGPQPLVWRPPVDPVTGEAQWDSAYGPGAAVAPVEEPSKKSRRSITWRRGAKAGAVGAAAGAGAAALAEGPDASGYAAPPAPGAPPWAGPAVAAPAGGLTDGTSAPGTWTTAPDGSPAEPFAAPPGPEGGAFPPVDGAAPSGRSAKGNRTAVLLLVVLLIVVAAGGALYYVKKHNNTSSTPVVTPTTAPGGVAADLALAGSINLRQTDLPVGWTRATAPAVRPPAVAPAAQLTAVRALASCLGQPLTVVSGLFGTGVLPGQQAAVRSPTFASGTDPNIQMYSTTSVLATAADGETAAAAFAAPTFATCYAQYQSQIIAASAPGATAAVQTVSLTAPAGVTSHGYVTTYTIPGQGTEVVGEGYLLGGRTETRLQPSTNGPAIPGGAFTPAYNAVVARVAQAASR